MQIILLYHQVLCIQNNNFGWLEFFLHIFVETGNIFLLHVRMFLCSRLDSPGHRTWSCSLCCPWTPRRWRRSARPRSSPGESPLRGVREVRHQTIQRKLNLKYLSIHAINMRIVTWHTMCCICFVWLIFFTTTTIIQIHKWLTEMCQY